MTGAIRGLATILFIVATGCHQPPPRTITLATTTSVQDTGLLDTLLTEFRARTGVEVRPVVVGTGQALEIGRRGDADVLLTHDPVGEDQFIADGYGVERAEVMNNTFVLVGPPGDPAGVAATRSAVAAFRRLAELRPLFVSRADESGTHQVERRTWTAAGVTPAGEWYIQAGQGQAAALRMASEKGAYALTDRGTYLAQRDRLTLTVVSAGDPAWVNRYSVTLVNPARHPHVRHELAREFSGFLLSTEGQRLIAEFGRESHGEPLFYPRVVENSPASTEPSP